MTRFLSYPVQIVNGHAHAPHIHLPLALDGMAAENCVAHLADMAATIPNNTVSRAARVFAALTGEKGNWTPTFSGDAVFLPLPLAVVAQPWRVAILLNLIDFSVYSDNEELRLIKQATIAAPAMAGLSPSAAFADLERHMARARMAMTERLPKDFWLDDYEKDQWPEDSAEYFFDITLQLSRAMNSGEQKAMSVLLGDLEMMVAWMGFATSGSAEEWVNAGKMVYAGGAEAGGATISYTAQRPPSDISSVLLMTELLLGNRCGISVTSWNMEITAGH